MEKREKKKEREYRRIEQLQFATHATKLAIIQLIAYWLKNQFVKFFLGLVWREL